jgi:hypothetical protein
VRKDATGREKLIQRDALLSNVRDGLGGRSHAVSIIAILWPIDMVAWTGVHDANQI